MTPQEWYTRRVTLWTGRADALNDRSVTVSRLRLATFFGGIALFWWGFYAHHLIAIVLGFATAVSFFILVVIHARLLSGIEHANAARRVAELGIARLLRDWNTLEEVKPPDTLDLDAHPYARDLDVFGHASLTKWLGTTATPTGESTLASWLLSSASDTEVAARQSAIEELAGNAEWREGFAAEGQRGRAGTRELDRFLGWAEGRSAVVPSWLQPLVIVLTASIWVLIALHAIAGRAVGWWSLPMLVGMILSFAFTRRLYRVFDSASIGSRALERYSALLTLACGKRWSADELKRLQSELRDGGDAPHALKRLSRLVDWSELRTAAALLHFPIQALTLWDFHVFFAIGRWQRVNGARVRPWLTALGRIDSLSVLSAIRHDAPAWASAAVSADATSLSARALGHPLIGDDRRVGNDVEVGPAGTLLLITGSNMSGKSTLLRAIGLNAVLAQAGAPVCAESFTMPPCDVETSIRVQDSLERGLSYFMAALARLKGIVDAAERDRPESRRLLYLLDEVLQGTNSAERAIAVRAVAQHLLDAGGIGAMTTHDLTIAHEEPFASRAQLVHFSEQVHEDGTMTFDYRLKPGLATSRNALRLMQLIGITPK